MNPWSILITYFIFAVLEKKGIEGIKGIEGEEGIKGIKGIGGVKGIKGVKGIEGIEGIKGIKGKNRILERLSELVSENLIACPELDSGSRLWEGLWERIILKVCKVQRLLLTFNFLYPP